MDVCESQRWTLIMCRLGNEDNERHKNIFNVEPPEELVMFFSSRIKKGENRGKDIYTWTPIMCHLGIYSENARIGEENTKQVRNYQDQHYEHKPHNVSFSNLFGLYCCLLLIDKSRVEDKTYI